MLFPPSTMRGPPNRLPYYLVALAPRRPAPVERLIEGFLTGPSITPPHLRKAVMDRAAALARGEAPPAVPPDLAGYLDKVATAAYSLGDTDLDGLRAAGHSEDEIIELTEAAALGASLARLDIALEAIDGD